MSYTEIYGFDKTGNAYFEDEVKNSFRSAMAIWQTLEDRYLPKRIVYGMEMSRTHDIVGSKIEEIWGLYKNDKVSYTDKICLHTTFDACLVKKENLPKVIKAFREFEGETSLKEQADILEKMYADENCIAVGWNQTSVNGDEWSNKGGYDEENDCHIPYNCLSGEYHYWLFDELEEKG